MFEEGLLCPLAGLDPACIFWYARASNMHSCMGMCVGKAASSNKSNVPNPHVVRELPFSLFSTAEPHSHPWLNVGSR